MIEHEKRDTEGVTYRVEESERIPGLDWVASYGPDGKRLCTPVSYRTHELAVWAKEVYERFDALEGDARRGLLPELKYSPAVLEAMEEDLLAYVEGRLCAGQVARMAHEVKKEFVRAFGVVPDTAKRDALAAFDDAGPDERRAYIDELIPNWRESHIIQREPIQRWVACEIDGKKLWNELLAAQAIRSNLAYTFPG